MTPSQDSLQFESIMAKLEPILKDLQEFVRVQIALKRWNVDDGWWETEGYRSILKDAVRRMHRHHKRHTKCLERAAESVRETQESSDV